MKKYLPPLILLIITVLFSVLVAFHKFSVLNDLVHASLSGFNQTFYQISDILGYLVLFCAALYVLLAFLTLIKLKSFKKVPKEFYVLAGLYAVTLVLYVLFDKFPINFRPVLLPGDTTPEPSFPSSHTLFAITFLISGTLINAKVLPALLRRHTKIINILLYVLAGATVLTRLLSGVHWFTDIIGGLLISCTLLSFFYACIYNNKHEQKHT